ncbi:hypothetical protein BP5796_07632 [Coleophoma crateriformis]|uniref:Heterokaryon incompatibility domain-containing protein n=1 Tax=Coleophoma crateriformis TaxID=565419 RepID=A0A3D8RJP0_9HELO|nr:hypothetical protein BP5796_07632 [Coleophoma crateriformis]
MATSCSSPVPAGSPVESEWYPCVMAKLISSWLNACTENHVLCKPPSPSKLPKRLLDVLSRDNPFLLETNGEEGPYLALSYCWGKQRKLALMTFGPNSRGKRGQPDPTPNIEAHKTNIPFAAMPKTLQDAVTTTRQLGFRYLWIDALCIIQGDEDEWQHQHPLLADVYLNARLVLAADSAVDQESGFLQQLSTVVRPDTRHLESRWTQALADQHLEQNAREESSTRCPSPLNWDEPLNQRAWSLSEAIFANRIVHFTSLGMVWECNEIRECEKGCVQTLQEDDTDSFRLFRDVAIAKDCTPVELYRKWDTVVEHFTRRNINSHPDETYKDSLKLVALARMAGKFSQILEQVLGRDDRYLAGIWRDNLASSLLWTTDARADGNLTAKWRRPEAPRAPTWSWASIEGPVFFNQLEDYRPAIIIDDASVEYCNPCDEFGQVLSGSLAVQGRLLHGLKIQRESLPDSNGIAERHVKISPSTPYIDLHFSCDVPLSESELGHEYSCLYLGRGEVGVATDEGTRTYWACLLLRPVPNKSKVFERAGVSCRSRSADTSTYFGNSTYESIEII